MPGAPALVPIREAAKRLGVSLPTLRRWDRLGKLRATRDPLTGRRVYYRDTLDSMVAGQRGKAITATTVDTSSPPTSFVGRAVELRRIVGALESGTRLVTIVGPGGIGKTTLLARAGRELAARNRSLRIVSCTLTDVPDERILATIGAALGVETAGTLDEARSIDLVGRRLSRLGATVVALDDAEHVVARVALLVRAWRVRAPDVCFLVASRQRLRLRDELVVLLGSLTPTEATTLLVEAAHRANATVDPRRDAKTLAKIARRLDGIPLALELAAPRLVVMDPQALLSALDVQLDVLVDRRRDAPARHATLRAAIASSYAQLDPEERTVFERLSVFAGGFTARAVEAVTNDGAPGRGLAALESLCERSLVHAVPASGTPRFDLYESLRQFAAERLARAPRDLKEAHQRHVDHFASLGVQALEAAPTDIVVEAIASERENVLVAFERSVARGGRAPLLLAIAADVAAGGTLSIAARERLLDAALKKTAGVERRILARAYATRGRLRVERSDLPSGTRDLRRALALARQARDPALEEYVLGFVAVARFQAGARADVVRALARAERLALRKGPLVARALTWAHIGIVRHELGDLEGAERSFTRAVVVARAEGQSVLVARMRARLGRVYCDRGKLDDAADALVSALETLSRAGDRFEAWTRAHEGLLRWKQGRLDDAREAYERAIALAGARGAIAFEVMHRTMRAALLCALGRAVDASDELERARLDAEPFGDPGLVAAIDLASAHRAALDLRRAHRAGDAVRARRATEEIRASLRRTRGMQARDKDVRALAERLQQLPDDLPTAPALIVAGDGGWLTPPNAPRATIPEGSPLRSVLGTLVGARLSERTSSVSRDALVASAWPGERILPRAAAHRLHVAASELRALGLGDRLERTSDGYRLAPSLPVRVEG